MDRRRSGGRALRAPLAARAQEYARQHGTNLSRLVSDLLRALPLEAAFKPSSPIVRRLSGVARGGDGREASPPSRVLIDVNVVLDVLLGRSPWDAEAQVLFDRIASGAVVGIVAAHTLTTIHYLVERAKNRTTARATVRDLLALFEVAPVGRGERERC